MQGYYRFPAIHKDKIIFEGKINRSVSEIHRTLKERGDPGLIFSARLNIEIKK